MYRNQYDNDITVWSPVGRLHQVEYAMEAVKQGSAVVGVKSDEYVVLSAKKRAPSELSGYQKKIFVIDDHVGIGISGLTADGRVLSKYMRRECMSYKWEFGSVHPISRLVEKIADKSQANTQRYGSRPFGVGLLVAGVDKQGTHLFQTCPSGNVFEYKAMTIGARSQSAKTYLEKHFESFVTADRDTLIRHCLKALKDTVQEGELDVKNTSVIVVGKNEKVRFVEGDELQLHIDAVGDYGVPPPTAPTRSVVDDALMEER